MAFIGKPRGRPTGFYFWVDNEVQDHPDLDVLAKATYFVLCRRSMQATSTARLTLEEIARQAGISVSSVKRAIKKLQAFSLIELERGRYGGASKYLLLRVKKKVAHENPAKVLTELPSAQGDRAYKENNKKLQNNPTRVDFNGEADFKALVMEKYQKANNLPFCPWGKEGDKALEKLLNRCPGLTSAVIVRCIDHYFASVISLSSPPYKWLPDVIQYFDGPLDEFGKPLFVTGEGIRRSHSASRH
jgi:DNA-binding MarR family transcriptional regulator